MNKGPTNLVAGIITGISSLIFFTIVGFSLSTSSSVSGEPDEFPTVNGGSAVATIALTIVFAIVVFFISRVILEALFGHHADSPSPTATAADTIAPSSSMSASDKRLLFDSTDKKRDSIKYLSVAGGLLVAIMDAFLIAVSLFSQPTNGFADLAVLFILPFAVVDFIVSTVFLVKTIKGKRSALKFYLIYTIAKVILSGPFAFLGIVILALPLTLLGIAFIKLRNQELRHPQDATTRPVDQQG